MLSRISGAHPTGSSSALSTPSDNASQAPVEDARSSLPSLPSANDSPSLRTESLAPTDSIAIYQTEAADARAFWHPNDVWASITQFSSRSDVLALRTANKALNAQADQAIRSVRISADNLPSFIHAVGFKSLTNLDVSQLDHDALSALIPHLAAHPRPNLTLDLRHLNVDVANLTILSAASFKALRLKLYQATTEQLSALAACRFPIDLDLAYATRPGALHEASSIPTLQWFSSISGTMTQAVAARFLANGCLKTLSISSDRYTAPQTLQTLAAIPTLREFRIDGVDAPVLHVATAHTLAANPSLESLDVACKGAALDEEGFAALSQSRTLRRLRLPLSEGIAALVDLTSLRHLELTAGYVPALRTTLDVAAAHSIASLPQLVSLSVPHVMNRAPGSLVPILENSPVTTLQLCDIGWSGAPPFNDKERAALLANRTLKTLDIPTGYVLPSDRLAILNHPTIDHVKLGVLQYRRVPGSNVPLTLT